VDTKERAERYGASARVSRELFARVAQLAQDERRTLRAQLDILVEEALEAREARRLETRGGAA
jgi:hypothetical protein